MGIISTNSASAFSEARNWMKENLPHLKEGKDFELTQTVPVRIVVLGRNVVLCNYQKEALSVSFERVDDGGFICSHSQLKSMKGFPEKVAFFDCSFCKGIVSLDGVPKEVNGDFCVVGCGKKFSEEDIRAKCDVKGNVYC